ncbi:MAG: radical SAM protein [Thermosphaera aggregans]|jgi:MoaA/NifB/PqqE/SkfB family radical SAM enzyme|uniref:radical SAM protein n=1 Tax=Thermosphaera aggregans TaxID=54254 RepID=UPI003BFE0024
MRIIEVDIFSDCNLKCKHCRAYKYWINPNKGLKVLPLKFLEKAIEVFNPSVLVLSGGEPLLRPNICDVIRMLKDYGDISISITTNGTIIPSCLQDVLTDEILIQVSIDGPRDFHDKFRGVKGTYEKAKSFIAKFSGKTLVVQTTVVKQNIPYIHAMINDLVKVGAYIFNLRMVLPGGLGFSNYKRLSPDFYAYLKVVIN